MSPPSSITSPPSSITEQASVSPARQSRKKRLSREEEETAEHNEFLPLPTPKESAAFLSQNCSMLLATFSFALIWFAQIAKGACHVHAKGVAEVRVSTPSNLDLSPSTSAVSHLERSKTAGRFLATGHLGLALNEESRALRSPSAARSPQRTNAAGRFLATGHMGILLDTPEDAPASRPAAAAWDPERSNAAGRFLAMGHMGLAMNEDVSAVPPPAGAAPGVHERSDAGLFLATGIFGLVFSQEPYSVLNMRTSEALVSLSPAEENGFVMTCALVHTLIVCVGIAIGNDTLSDIHALTELLQTVAALFVLFCAALWWSWECTRSTRPHDARALSPPSRRVRPLPALLSMPRSCHRMLLRPHHLRLACCTSSVRVCSQTRLGPSRLWRSCSSRAKRRTSLVARRRYARGWWRRWSSRTPARSAACTRARVRSIT